MTQALDVTRRCKVLEIGTGSGYQAAILRLSRSASLTLDRWRTLITEAEERLRQVEILNVTMMVEDGRAGWAAEAPFDRIVLTASVETLDEALAEQIAPRGRLVAPIGRAGAEAGPDPVRAGRGGPRGDPDPHREGDAAGPRHRAPALAAAAISSHFRRRLKPLFTAISLTPAVPFRCRWCERPMRSSVPTIPSRYLSRVAATALIAGLAAGCSSDTSRFASNPFSNPFASQPPQTASIPTAQAYPTQRVQSRPLAPVGTAAYPRPVAAAAASGRLGRHRAPPPLAAGELPPRRAAPAFDRQRQRSPRVAGFNKAAGAPRAAPSSRRARATPCNPCRTATASRPRRSWRSTDFRVPISPRASRSPSRSTACATPRQRASRAPPSRSPRRARR